MGGRFPVLDQCAHSVVAGGNICDSVVRTYEVTESKWGGAVLLAVLAYCMECQAAVFDQPADICESSAVLCGILCGVCAGGVGVWVGVASAEEEECVSGIGRRG